MAPPIATERIYEVLKTPRPDNEVAVLCDRLWPRGVRREDLEGVLWMKEWAPTGTLRQAFHSGQISTETFRKRYRDELVARRDELQADLQRLGISPTKGKPSHPIKTLRLLTASREIEGSHVPVLRDYLEELLSPRPMP